MSLARQDSWSEEDHAEAIRKLHDSSTTLEELRTIHSHACDDCSDLEDEDGYLVGELIAMHPNADESILLDLVDSDKEWQTHYAIENPNCTTKVLAAAAKCSWEDSDEEDEDSWNTIFQELISNHPLVTPEILQMLKNP